MSARCEHRWFLHPVIINALHCVDCRETLLAIGALEVEVKGPGGSWDAASLKSSSGPRFIPATLEQKGEDR